MLKIREEQLDLLGGEYRGRLLLRHVRTFFPEESEALGPRLEGVVGRASRDAAKYGFTSLCEIQEYVDVVIVLGEGFESRPDCLWAKEILSDRNPAHEPFRASQLIEKAIEYLSRMEEGA